MSENKKPEVMTEDQFQDLLNTRTNEALQAIETTLQGFMSVEGLTIDNTQHGALYNGVPYILASTMIQFGVNVLGVDPTNDEHVNRLLVTYGTVMAEVLKTTVALGELNPATTGTILVPHSH